MFLGDLNQTINIAKSDLNIIKTNLYRNEIPFNEYCISKNYRNGSEVIELINAFNKLKSEKNDKLGKDYHQAQEAIKDGEKARTIFDLKNERDFFYRIDQDVNSIVIVGEEQDKESLKEKGYPLGRVFSVEEVRGLEYNNVYCYNIMCGFKDKWDAILTGVGCQYNYILYFNMLYIAVTRTKKNLSFIESAPTKISDKISPYYKLLNDEHQLFEAINNNYSISQWEQEAKKLESMGKYYQAAEAYKKAGNIVDAEICLKALDKKINFDYTENFASYIVIESKNQELDCKLLEDVLVRLTQKYGVAIGKTIHIKVNHVSNMQMDTMCKYIDDPTQLNNIANTIFEVLNKTDIDRQLVKLKVCFYKNAVPVDMKTILGKNNEDIQISICNNNIYIHEFYYSSIREFDLISEVLGTEIAPYRLNEAEAERNQQKYSNMTADDILRDIFNSNT